MVGLLGPAKPAAASPARPGAMPPAAEPVEPAAAAAGEEAANVSPEEQATYDRFVANGISMIFDKRTAPALLERLAGNGNPVEGLAATTVFVVSRLEESAARKGTKLSGDVLMQGGAELMANLADLAEAGGVHEYTPEEIENAMYAALDQYGTDKLQRGTLDKEAIASDFQAMSEADRAGKIEELIPGITAKADEIKARGARPPAAAAPAPPRGA